ncbi:MAG: ketosteroid isomerase-like protein [Bacteriovoracaceae bacterium]|jgi:ketosteroid isomerase-like protein
MSKLYLTYVLALCFSNSVYAHESTGDVNKILFQGIESIPAKVVVDFHNALKSSKKDEVFKLLEESVLIYEGGGVERSAKEYSSHHLLADMAFMSKMEVELIEHQVTIYSNIAISSSRSIIRGKYKGKVIEKTNMETIVLRKINGKWKIINIHWS